MLATHLQHTTLGLLQLRGWWKQDRREAASLPAEGPRGKPPSDQHRGQRERPPLPNHWALLTWPEKTYYKRESLCICLEIPQPSTTSTQKCSVIHSRTSTDGPVKSLRRWAWMHGSRRRNAGRHNSSSTEQGLGLFVLNPCWLLCCRYTRRTFGEVLLPRGY